jgi:hypothetical protein
MSTQRKSRITSALFASVLSGFLLLHCPSGPPVHHIRPQHLSRRMADEKRNPVHLRDILRCHAASPEHRQFIGQNLFRITEIRHAQIGNPGRLRLADVQRPTMHLRKAASRFAANTSRQYATARHCATQCPVQKTHQIIPPECGDIAYLAYQHAVLEPIF